MAHDRSARGPARALRAAAAAASVAVSVAACAVVAPPRVPPPSALYEQAQPLAAPGVRIWGDDLDPTRAAEISASLRAGLVAEWRAAGAPPDGAALDVLALSGGGPDGAYAAGLLTGLTLAGERPDFDIVTGISVGALIAPFAFAGPDHDDELETMFTRFDTDDIAELQIFAVLQGALGVADTQPMRNQIRSLVDERLLARIAARHAAGKLLLVGTTNIDAARPVIWNMGAIAQAGATELFRQVMLASASIPGAFPPVAIPVIAGGETFTELHVDGGVTRSVFVGPPGFADAAPRNLPFPLRRTIYVIQNNSLTPNYDPAPARLATIAGRSLSALIRAQSEGDLARIAQGADAMGAEFRLAFVPPGFTPPSPTSFDRAYMTGLFNAAQEAAGGGGFGWLHAPPGLVARSRLILELSKL
ncbi:patatin-like phospholipase family protein [Rubrimonas cliftonensis]|uniref:Patatin-like phospholipase n=1 Tax=Rubrimonas cliftonensis TaxID=89524 RepID=A0A1H4DX97_9RHOB|nr:patatin-like phospholipase family protein [Rubrimonas cliftonensis]SEA76990.1 Patatin-like phospholipase [Rubrimonas cliftonensis]